MTQIFNIQQWFNGKNENLVEINLKKTMSLLEKCPVKLYQKWPLMKPLIETHPFFYYKGESEHPEVYPNMLQHLNLYNFIDNNNCNGQALYMVFPLNKNRFGLIRNNEWKGSILEKNTKNVGIFQSPVKWLDTKKKYELWTDEPCVLIEYKIWKKIYKKFKNV